jgi:hypothetical protein
VRNARTYVTNSKTCYLKTPGWSLTGRAAGRHGLKSGLRGNLPSARCSPLLQVRHVQLTHPLPVWQYGRCADCSVRVHVPRWLTPSPSASVPPLCLTTAASYHPTPHCGNLPVYVFRCVKMGIITCVRNEQESLTSAFTPFPRLSVICHVSTHISCPVGTPLPGLSAMMEELSERAAAKYSCLQIW